MASSAKTSAQYTSTMPSIVSSKRIVETTIRTAIRGLGASETLTSRSETEFLDGLLLEGSTAPAAVLEDAGGIVAGGAEAQTEAHQ